MYYNDHLQFEQLLRTFLEEKPGKRKLPDEVILLQSYLSLLILFYLFIFYVPFLCNFYFLKLFFKPVNLSVFQVVQTTDMSGFIVDDVDDDILDEEEDEEEDVFDSVCAFCDNGGDLLWYVLFNWLSDN